MRPFHPLADIFPLIEGAEFDALVSDVKTHGLRDPIDVLDDMILDGRNRARACEACGVDPTYIPFRGTEADALSFVISRNLNRRHLNESQRAMVADKLATLNQGDNSNAQICALPQDDAAKKLNVSRRTVQHARQVRENAAPEVVAAVEQGQLSVTAASEISELPKAEQRDLLTKGRKRVVEKSKEIRASKHKAKTTRLPKNQSAPPSMQLIFDWQQAPTERRQHFVSSIGLPAIYAFADEDHKRAFVKTIGLRAFFEAAPEDQRAAFLADLATKSEQIVSAPPTAYPIPGDGLDIPDFLKSAPA